jgi:hypothetical protein
VCRRRRGAAHLCACAGVLRLDRLDQAVTEALAGYFSDAQLAVGRERLFWDATNAETERRHEETTRATRVRDQCVLRIERIKEAIFNGATGPTMAAELRKEETKLQEAEQDIRAAEIRKTTTPAMMPPPEIIASLRVEGFYARRAALRALIDRIDLRSVKEGNHRAECWDGHIPPDRPPGFGIWTPWSFRRGPL